MTATRSLNPREERRLLHQELSRTQLLDAAEEIFGQKGFHDTTLKEIADRADFSVGSVYSFFQNKDDLYVNVWLRRGAELLLASRPLPRTAGGWKLNPPANTQLRVDPFADTHAAS
jgi:AcrR family transcriptional regulator